MAGSGSKRMRPDERDRDAGPPQGAARQDRGSARHSQSEAAGRARACELLWRKPLVRARGAGRARGAAGDRAPAAIGHLCAARRVGSERRGAGVAGRPRRALADGRLRAGAGGTRHPRGGGRAAGGAPPHRRDLAAMRAVIDGSRASLRRGANLADDDEAFHLALIAAAKNPILCASPSRSTS